MGKTSKKTKAKKKDFNKVKLKVGKQRPKASNATEISFKSQSIYITEQLKTSSLPDELLTHRKKSLADLQTDLNHPSSTIRLQSLNGIKELLTSNISIFECTKLLERVVKLILDDDHQVRKQVVFVLRSLFTQIQQFQMKPHFVFILKHLFCAMAHIDSQIQRDSLQIVDLCLEHFSSLIEPQDCRRLMENFIEMISTEQGKKGCRVLTMNLSKKETSISWRIGVLSRLEKLIDLCYQNRSTVTVAGFPYETLPWDSKKMFCLSATPEQQGVILRQFDTTIIKVTHHNTLDTLIKSIFPLMLQCWMEVCNGEIILHSEDIQVKMTMIHVLTILNKICQNVCEHNADMKHWIYETHMKGFAKHMFDKFPFERPIILKHNNSINKTRTAVSGADEILSINVLLCKLGALFCDFTPTILTNKIMKQILDFIFHLLKSAKKYTSMLNTSQLDNILKSVKSFAVLGNSSDLNEIIGVLFMYYQSLSPKHGNKAMVTLFYLYMFETNEHTNEQMNKIVATLPYQLLMNLAESAKLNKKICELTNSTLKTNLDAVIDFVKVAISRNSVSILEGLNNNYIKIYDFLLSGGRDIFCNTDYCAGCEKYQMVLFELTIPNQYNLNDKCITRIRNVIKQDWMLYKNVCYAADMIVCRVSGQFVQQTVLDILETTAALKFLLSLIFDTAEQISDTDVVKLVRHEYICEHVCRSLFLLCEQWQQLKCILCSFIKSKTKTENNSAAWIGILHLVQLFHEKNNCKSDFSSLLDMLPKNTTNFSEVVMSTYFQTQQAKQFLVT